MTKPKVAFYSAASCGGCEEAVINLDEDLLKVMDAVDIILWPAFFDFKSKDIEALEDGEIAVSFVSGAVRLSEQEEMVKLLRQKSQLVVAFGSCAHMGGIPGLGNLFTRDAIFQRVYKESRLSKIQRELFRRSGQPLILVNSLYRNFLIQ